MGSISYVHSSCSINENSSLSNKTDLELFTKIEKIYRQSKCKHDFNPKEIEKIFICSSLFNSAVNRFFSQNLSRSLRHEKARICRKLQFIVKKVENFLSSREAAHVFRSAAVKGKAFTRGIQATLELSDKIILPLEERLSKQTTYLDPDEKYILKTKDPRAYEEEYQFNETLSFLLTAFPAGWNFNRLSLNDLKNKLDINEGRFSSHECYSLAVNNEQTEKTLLQFIDPKAATLHSRMKIHKLFKAHETSFFFITVNQSLFKHKLDVWSERKWSYHVKGSTLPILQAHQLLSYLHLSSPGNDDANDQLMRALLTEDEATEFNKSISWGIAYPEILIQIDEENDEDDKSYSALSKDYSFKNSRIQPLGSTDVKSFVKQMLKVQQLKGSLALEKIFSRLTPISYLMLLATLQKQTLDLHLENIGIKPILNSSLKKFQSCRFTLNQSILMPSQQKDYYIFTELQLAYLNDCLPVDCLISYQNLDKKNIPLTLQEQQDLFKALNCDWQIVLFDGNYVFATSNHFYRISNQHCANARSPESIHIPIRNDLLECLDTIPIPIDAIRTLLKEKRSSQWMQRLDAPIWRHLSERTRRKIKPFLTKMLQDPIYNLNYYKKDPFANLNATRNTFAFDLCFYFSEELKEFWNIIINDLRTITIREGDTYPKIAKRYKQNISELVKLNQNKFPKVGEKFYLENPMSYMTQLQRLKWKYKLAKQFFPRLTFDQQFASNTRLRKVKKYLDLYEQIKNHEGPINEMFILIRLFYRLSVCTFLQRQDYYKHFGSVSNPAPYTGETINRFKQKIIRDFSPSLTIVAKSMYPYLGDTMDLSNLLNRKTRRKKWFYTSCLLKMISQAYISFQCHEEGYLIAKYLFKNIKQDVDPFYLF